MAITINKKNVNKHVDGITTGNEHIWKVSNGNVVTISGVLQAAGSATVKYSLQESEPTDFTDFATSEVGSHTTTFAEVASIGVKWIGIDVSSGTWDVDIVQTKTV